MRACTALVLAPLCLAALACSKDKPELAPVPGASTAQAAAARPAERATLDCLTIEPPAGSTRTAAQMGGGLAFRDVKKLQAGRVSYDPTFTVSTQAAEGASADSFRDELLKTSEAGYAQLQSSAARSGLRPSSLLPPNARPADVGGQPGHYWQVDTIAAFNGENLPWRAFSITTVFRDRIYVVTAAAAVANVADFKAIAGRFFGSVRFDGCPTSGSTSDAGSISDAGHVPDAGRAP